LVTLGNSICLYPEQHDLRKTEDVKAMPDRALALTLFNGATRNSENEEMAKLLRKKSQLLVAHGSCSVHGSTPALSNLHTRDAHLLTNYLAGPSLDNEAGILPQTQTAVPEGMLELPMFYPTVKTPLGSPHRIAVCGRTHVGTRHRS
jgi:F420-non-reducing hydrogenase small subunit